MKKEPTEKEIENSILAYLQTQKGFFWKNQSVGVWDNVRKTYRKPNNRFHINGTADVLGCLPGGKFIALEVKTKRGRATQNQKDFLQRISVLGGKAAIVKSIDDVKAVLEEMNDL